MGLKRERIKQIIADLKKRVDRDDCWTCDCLQGLIVQLEMDADEDVADILGPLKVEKEKMHGCLGCSPCHGGEAFVEYIKSQNG